MISNSAWYGDLTTTWPLTRIKHGFSRISSGTTPPSEEAEYYGGGIPWVTTSELRETRIMETAQTLTEAALEDFSTLKLYDPDTILFAMYGATIGRVGTLGISATVNQAVCALSQPTRFVPGFAVYALQASRDYLVSIASGGGQPNLNAAKLRDHALPCPPLAVQHRIADYLDVETAEIDALIAEKERMLALLEEQRAAVVTHAVTRGLDPNVPRKPSGLEWLGEIPEHWNVMQLKRTWSSAEYGISESIRDEGEIRVLRMSCITRDGLVDLENAGQIDEVPGSMLVHQGDLLFNRTNSLDQIAKVGWLPEEPEVPTSFASYLVRIRLNERAKGEYMVALLNCRDFLLFARSNAIPAIGQANLSPSRYGDIHIPLPSTSEQGEIATYLVLL